MFKIVFLVIHTLLPIMYNMFRLFGETLPIATKLMTGIDI